MVRFLSAEWFQRLSAEPVAPARQGGAGSVAGAGAGPAGDRPMAADDVVALEIVVTDAPGGEVRYQVVVEGLRARAQWRQRDFRGADVKFIADYATISGIASGRLAAVQALAEGRAHVSGNTALLSRFPAEVDLVPHSLRAVTTFD